MADLDHAGTIADARQLLERCRYDLVILDITLPDGSGQELLPVLNGATPPIPVMVYSAGEMECEDICNVDFSAGEVTHQRCTTAGNHQTIDRG